MTLIIDGTDEYGCYAGDGQNAPFVVFCPELQENVTQPFRWRWQAALARRFMLWVMKP